MNFDQQLGELQRKVTQCQEGIGRRKIIIDSLAPESGQSILDLGCGGGYQVRSLALAVGSGGRIVGSDPSLKQIEAAREYCSDLDNVEFTQDSGTDLSFGDGTFDSATSTNVLDYITDVESVVAEIRRVLKKGGRFCNISVLWDHHRFHGPDPTLNDEVHHVFRDHCPHQMLPLELPKMLLANGFAGIGSVPIPILNKTMHDNAFAFWTSKVISIFAINNGMPEDDVALWQRQLEEADRDGRFGFVSMSVLTTGVSI